MQKLVKTRCPLFSCQFFNEIKERIYFLDAFKSQALTLKLNTRQSIFFYNEWK